MKSRRNTLRVLLDTAFILPTLGINVGKEVEEGIRKLEEIEAELYYSRFSILESFWIAVKLIKNQSFDIEIFSQGLRSVIEGGRYVRADGNHKIFKEALRLYILGHRDLIDNILYTTSTNLNLKLLTVDNELKEFIRSKGLKDTLISPDQITI